MRLNTRERWGSVSIGLHWTIAALILLVQVPAGITMLALDRGTLQDVLFTTHKNVGLVIFTLAVIRLAWRWSHPVPALPADMPPWQSWLARSTHALLYILILLMPISGFLYTAMGGFPVPLLGLYDIAWLVPENEPVAEMFQWTHFLLQFVLYAVVVLHVAGALQHHFVRRDYVLRRMLSSTASLPEAHR